MNSFPPMPHSMVKRKDDDLEDEVSPFFDLRKNLVLRDARCFSDRELNPAKCGEILTKLLFLLCKGEELDNTESTEVFFGVTKLFQSNDQHLRRLIYLMIKELSVSSDNSLIVVACLSKDMNSKVDLFRANSIRVLARIMDSNMVSQMERFLKQSLVANNSFIVSSTLIAAQLMYPHSSEIIKRWSNEVQEALNNKNKMVPFHALSLLYKMKQNDRLAINKIVSSMIKNQFSNNNTQSPMAQLLHIRITTQLLNIPSQPLNQELFKYLLDCLHSKNVMIMYEAARSILSLNTVQPQQMTQAINVLQEMLNSNITTHKFAAVRILSQIVTKYPFLVHSVITDLEHCINDSNRNIATLAITTLLKTGVENNVERLLKSLQGFMSDSSDEFKMVLIEAISTLSLKFPAKYSLLLNFLSAALREEGGYKYKKCIVDCMLSIINSVKESAELGLEHFCEFIEDCEFPELSIRILHLLGEKGPTTANPAKYIRYIFNRVILETASVRCAAISSLASFACSIEALKSNILVLLTRCCQDEDDEVRERAVFYLSLLNNDKLTKSLLAGNNTRGALPNLVTFEYSLQNYLNKNMSSNESFNMNKHLIQLNEEIISREEGFTSSSNKQFEKAAKTTSDSDQINAASTNNTNNNNNAASNAADTMISNAPVNPHLSLLSSIPELLSLGSLFKSSLPIELTEPETEYVVTCIKHLFPQHFLFQFNITNNLEGHLLQSVSVQVELPSTDFSEDFVIPEPSIKFGSDGVCFVAVQRPSDQYNLQNIRCTLKFTVRELEENGEVNEADDGHDDEYELEELEIVEGDFMSTTSANTQMGLVEFRRQWESLGDSVEVVKKYSLGLSSLQQAVNAIVELLGMSAVEQSNVVAEGNKSHAVNLTGVFYPNINVLARAGFLLDSNHGVTLKIAVRSNDMNVNQLLTNAIR